MNQKIIKSFRFKLSCILACGILSACEGGGDDDNLTTFITPPADPTIATSTSGTTSTSGAVSANQNLYEAQVFTRINTERNSNSLSPLTRSSQLDALAASHNIYMRQQAPANSTPIQISHDNAQSRANAAFGFGFTRFGENVAGIRGYAASDVSVTFVNNWIGSPGHFQNITGDFTHTGIDVLVAADGTIYATQLFAK